MKKLLLISLVVICLSGCGTSNTNSNDPKNQDALYTYVYKCYEQTFARYFWSLTELNRGAQVKEFTYGYFIQYANIDGSKGQSYHFYTLEKAKEEYQVITNSDIVGEYYL